MSRILAALLAAATVVAASPVAVAAEDGRQLDYRRAAAEAGVPEPLLLAVSYLESRWDTNDGTPSTAAGYGPMHLADIDTANAGAGHHHGDEDPRGDTSRPPLHVEPGTPVPVESLRTLARAAHLTGIDPAALRGDPSANIRGGAALLAEHHRATGDWFEAVSRYGGGRAFADEVYSVLRTGATRVTDDGHRVRLAASPMPAPLAAESRADVECPADITCDLVPAPYQQLPNGGYGNHDKANRPTSQKIDYIVIHDTEATWDTTLKLVQDPAYVSWHYSLRSSDGRVAQHVPTKDVGWHAGNWYVNAKSIGLEHEGFAAQGTWYTEAMYRTSAKLVRYLASRYGVPLDRAHIIGHDNVPGVTPDRVKAMHWDPGPYWDWAHYFDLMGAPLRASGDQGSQLVTIKPDFASNKPAFTGCEGAATNPCPPRPSTSVVLRAQPRDDAPLLVDIGLHPDGSPSTMLVSDHGSRVATGQRFAVAERSGDWLAIWYLGQKGWLRASATVPATGVSVTPRPGLAEIPVYGRAYPQKSAYPPGVPVQDVVPLQYKLGAGQHYSLGLATPSEYYWAATFDPAQSHVVVRGEEYLQVQFGHRVAYVRAEDVVRVARA